MEIVRRGFNDDKRQSLYNLIRVARHRQATDPRDKIFSLLGLMGDKVTPYLFPDYTADVREIYARTTMHFISQSRSLDPICGWQVEGRMNGLPSWVSDYALDQDEAMHPINALYGTAKLFNACGEDHRGEYRFLDDFISLDPWTDLPTKGLVVDTITSTSPASAGASISEIISDWFSLVSDSAETASSLTPKDVELLRNTMSAVKGYADFNIPSSLDMLAPRRPTFPSDPSANEDNRARASYSVEAFIHCLFAGNIMGQRLKPSDIDLIMDFHRRLNADDATEKTKKAIGSSVKLGVERRRLFITREGYIGTGREDVVAGDLLCVLFGCSVPVVLRETRQEGRYAFVGEAYAHGWMDAEAIVMQIRGKLKEQVFILV